MASALTRNSDFVDRLDASFVVRQGRSDRSCVSLESAAYPGVWLATTGSGRVGVVHDPSDAAATWCPVPVRSPATGTRLISAADRTQALSVSTAGVVGVTTQLDASSVWFVDAGLALPVND